MYHVSLALPFICGRIDEGSGNGDVEEGSEISGGRDKVETTWPLVCR